MNGGESVGEFIVPLNYQNPPEQNQQDSVEHKIFDELHKPMKIKIIHSKDRAYDIYNGDTDEYIMTRCSADNVLEFIAAYDNVNIEFIDKTIIL